MSFTFQGKMKYSSLLHILVAILYSIQYSVTQECKDVESNCEIYKPYCDSPIQAYKGWMELSCSRTCKFCVDPPEPPPPPLDECEDKSGVPCGEFKKYGICTSKTYKLVVTNYCKRTCSFCECEDSEEYSSKCGGWAARGWCTLPDVEAFMNSKCKKSCGAFPCEKEEEAPPEEDATDSETESESGTGDTSCGQDNEIRSRGRIVGGVDAQKNRWHWQGGMYYVDPFSGSQSFKCGGSLIAKDMFLTAAHCVDGNTDERDLIIKLGDHDSSRKEKEEQTIKVKRIVVHTKWSRRTLKNDIALLQLEKGVKLGKPVGTICLPEKDVDPDTNAKCFITGWGKTDGSNTKAHFGRLQQAKLPIVTNEKCGTRNIDRDGKSRIGDDQLCAGYVDGDFQISGCQGDSGGPFVCEKDGKWFLQGVVSWGSRRCDTNHRYTVFTRVNKYIDWVDGIMENLRAGK